jgi:hypothetical protein
MSLIYTNPYAFPAAPSLPAIGAAYEGGFFAGTISHTGDGVATHALIVAPRATGARGSPYIPTGFLAWKTSTTLTTGTDSDFDGAANTAAMVTAGIANHPAANFCVGLSIGGYTDWYLPARYELDIAYFNLKPDTSSNNTSFGINDYSVPKRTSNYTAGSPAKTTVSGFDTSTEGFAAGSHLSSTQVNATLGWVFNFIDGGQFSFTKTGGNRVRAFRKIPL